MAPTGEQFKIPADFWSRGPVHTALRNRDIGALFRLLRRYAGASQSQIGAAVGLEQGYVSKIMNGRRQVTHLDLLSRVAAGCHMPDPARALLGLASATEPSPSGTHHAAQEHGLIASVEHAIPVGRHIRALPEHFVGDGDNELEAVELARRVAATDVSSETLEQLESVVDDLATKYPVSSPNILLRHARRYLSYVGHLLDARMSLDEHRRLLVVGAWLSLLGATLHVDLKQRRAAAARLETAASLAMAADHREIHAWCFETEAWAVLTDGDYGGAVELSVAAQGIAPKGSSAAIQATAQEGRAWARLGRSRETHSALSRVAHLVERLPTPDKPEHHYRYDPTKAAAYTATTLAWLGDAAAEPYARQVIAELGDAEKDGKWPRRVASAQLDLSLALIASGGFDEACAVAQSAILSGRIVPSNRWRALEIVRAAEGRGLPEARDLRDAYETPLRIDSMASL